MRIVLLSPYHGGSHRAWAEGWAAQSRHQITVLGLPAAFWKWRMHGGAVRLADGYLARFRDDPPDLLVATDMLDLAVFLALTRRQTALCPTLYYAHENQWTYPLPADPDTGPMRRQKGERDRHYAWINFTSMLAADRVAFNSRFHRDEYLRSLPAFLRHWPDERDPAWIERIAGRTEVLPLGIDLRRLDGPGASPPDRPAGDGPPLVLWNHRWEYDKDPEAFFRVIDAVAARGIPFRLAVCGTNPRTHTPEFDAAALRHAERIVHWGPAEPAAYVGLLRAADLVVSTARHEFFGISVCEAIYAGAFPLLPDRLAYPELIPTDLHPDVLYADETELEVRLVGCLRDLGAVAAPRERLRVEMARHDWSRRAPEYDDRVEAWFRGRSGLVRPV